MLKKLFKNEAFLLDEILFQGRNKGYGAYVLRNESDRILTKSMFIGIGLFSIVAATPFIINALTFVESPIQEKTKITFTPIIVDVEEDKPEVITPQVQHIERQVKTFDSSIPTPTSKPQNEQPVASQKQYNDAIAGVQNIDGEVPTTNYIPPVIDVIPTAPKIEAPVISTKPKVDAVQKNVDEEATFPTGINAFREKVQMNFDISAIEPTSETMKAIITFVVEKDGSISNIKVTGQDSEFNKEAELAIKKVKGKWIPAKLNGEIVRSYFRFPIVMRVE